MPARLAAVAVVAALAGCSVVFDFSPSQLHAVGDTGSATAVDAPADSVLDAARDDLPSVDLPVGFDISPELPASPDDHPAPPDVAAADAGPDAPAPRDVSAGTDAADATVSTDAADAVAMIDVADAPDGADATEVFDVADAGDARSSADAADAGDAPDAPDTTVDAGGTCDASLATDPANCGACGVHCATDQSCVGGHCFAACFTPEIFCGGRCVDPTSDYRNCGGCGLSCTASQRCCRGLCAPRCG